MFSGKTEELIRRLKRAQFANQKIEIYKPAVDKRYSDMDVVSHDLHSIPCIPITDAKKMLDAAEETQVLEQLATSGAMSYSTADAFLGFIPGCVGETSTLAILIGAAILLFTGVASWRTMSFVFIGGLAMGYFFQALGVTTYPAWEHLIVGGFAFGAVFMATDPVTSAQTRTGQYIVGFLTGALAVLIRVVNPAYPEGMMLAILFMNALAPLVDYCVVESSISRRKKRVKLVK